MISNKHITKIIMALMAVAVCLCFVAIAFSDKLDEAFGGAGVTMEYESRLFDTSELISVDIKMDEDTWNKMLQNATSEEYYVCDVVINGTKIRNVAIRPKGNTSLSAIAMDPDSNRYSLKLEFDHFVDGQTCFGLDKLILNNNYADATNMKEAIVYDMYQYLGADASLYNYAEVSVNGEYWGVYLALEGVEESFMLRNYGTQDGELYKPDTMEMGGGGDDGDSAGGGPGGMTPPSGDMPGGGGAGKGETPAGEGAAAGESAADDAPASDGEIGESAPANGAEGSEDAMPPFGGEGGSDPSNMPEGGEGGFDPSGMGDFDPSSMGDRSDAGGIGPGGGSPMGNNGGANLNYSDDGLDSYSTIWDGEVTGTGNADHRRVVTALKNISEGTDLEKYLDVDNVLKYMAVHTFSVNMDSLSGSMSHNYYLYEYDGQLNILPWDYNLSLGGMSMGGSTASEVVNDAIDTPFSGTKFFDALLSNEEYLERYHAYLRQLVDEYVNGGRFDEAYTRIRGQIDGLVETDPTAFYSYKEYEDAAEILYDTVKLRAQSIQGQLDGTIPSTDAGQRQDSSLLVDASGINIEAMGQFDMGGSFDGGFGTASDDEDSTGDTASEGSETTEGTTGESSGLGRPDDGGPGGGGPGGGQMPGNFDFGNMPEGFDASSLPEDFDVENMPEGFDMSSMPGGGSGFGPGQSTGASKLKNAITYAACLVFMFVAFLVAKLYRRRR